MQSVQASHQHPTSAAIAQQALARDITDRMVAYMRTIDPSSGSVTDIDLLHEGFSEAEIRLYGPAASVIALKQASRQLRRANARANDNIQDPALLNTPPAQHRLGVRDRMIAFMLDISSLNSTVTVADLQRGGFTPDQIVDHGNQAAGKIMRRMVRDEQIDQFDLQEPA